MKKQVMEAFLEAFGSSGDARTFFAPGRVNLIGEYTDFNGGHVLPCALTIGTYAVARKRSDNRILLTSVNFPEKGIVSLTLDDLRKVEEHGWANYPKGVASVLISNGASVTSGFEVCFGGNIPNGAGLSSSASIELATSVALNALFQLEIPLEEQAVLAQKAENQYIGVSCGIMDQFAIAMGQRGGAVLLNTDTMYFERVPLRLAGHRLVIANSNRRRGLADSKYNLRFRECREALSDLQRHCAIRSLGDISIADFEALADKIGSEAARKRARHAVRENKRVLRAAEILKDGDLKGFGALMLESHQSLRDDFEVSCFELDTLVAEAMAQEGVLGARLTGAGFGGCTVNLMDEAVVERFIASVGKNYEKITGYRADFYIAEAGDGAGEI